MGRNIFIEAGLGLFALGLTTSCASSPSIETNTYTIYRDPEESTQFYIRGRDEFGAREAEKIIRASCKTNTLNNPVVYVGERNATITVAEPHCFPKLLKKLESDN